MSKIIAFPYYGGKNSQLGWLLPLLPDSSVYVEPYGGSGAVLLNRTMSKLEVYNDLKGDIPHFFKVLRENTDELISLLQLSPYSRQEFMDCFAANKETIDDPVERARVFFVLQRQSFLANTRNWATSKYIRDGWGQMLSRWTHGIDGLAEVARRFQRVVIECRPAIDVIRIYDSPDTFQYLDPPYLHETRSSKSGYVHEMETADHQNLLSFIKTCASKIAISGYANSLYDRSLKSWHRHAEPFKQLAGPRGERQEILWTNYDPSNIRRGNQSSLVDFAEGLG